MATQSEVAAHIGVTRQAVSDMIARGVLPDAARGVHDLDACRLAYLRHMREVAAGRSGVSASGEALDLAGERARLAKEQADAQAMKNDVARGALILRGDVVAGMHAAFANARGRLLGIPTKVAPALVGEASMAVIRDKLTEAIHDACGELAATRAIPAPSDWPSDGGGGDGGDGAVGAAAEVDGERMGGSVPRPVARGKRRARPVED